MNQIGNNTLQFYCCENKENCKHINRDAYQYLIEVPRCVHIESTKPGVYSVLDENKNYCIFIDTKTSLDNLGDDNNKVCYFVNVDKIILRLEKHNTRFIRIENEAFKDKTITIKIGNDFILDTKTGTYNNIGLWFSTDNKLYIDSQVHNSPTSNECAFIDIELYNDRVYM